MNSSDKHDCRSIGNQVHIKKDVQENDESSSKFKPTYAEVVHMEHCLLVMTATNQWSATDT